ncbi:MAG: 30S ribosomal protein S2, partial [Ruminococcaceae bacterium]|nr:30S ribosomal protein S2 [Oscillospiraceae bacterium]
MNTRIRTQNSAAKGYEQGWCQAVCGGLTLKEEMIMANVVSMKQLLEAGVHFGHQT